MEPNAVNAAVATAQKTYADLHEKRDALSAEIQRINADPGLSDIGKQEKVAALRRGVETETRPTIDRLRGLVAEAVTGSASYSLDTLFQREEFRNLPVANPTPDLLARTHLATVLPRVAIDELDAMMTGALASREIWRVAMLRREAKFRLGAASGDEKAAIARIVSRALEAEPPDFAARRRGVRELERILPFAEILWGNIVQLVGFEHREEQDNAA